MRRLRPYVHAVLLLGMGTATAWAEDKLTTGDDWLMYLRSRKDRVPRCVVEWKMQRVLSGDARKADAAARQIKELIQQAPEGRAAIPPDKLKPLASDMAYFNRRTTFTVRLDYYTSDRFFIRQSLSHPEGTTDTDYYVGGDGLVYQEHADQHAVRVLPLAKAGVISLGELLRPLPELALSQDLPDIPQLDVMGAATTSVQLMGSREKRALRVYVESASRRIVNIQTGNVNPAVGGGRCFVSSDCSMQYMSPRVDAAYPVPRQALIRYYDNKPELQREETWTLTELQVQPDPSKMHRPQYEFKPGYKVTDETGEKPREYSTDDLPRGK